MTKESYVLEFPTGICGKKTIEVQANPLSLRNVVSQILESQPLVFGDLCIVRDNRNKKVLAIAAYPDGDDENKVDFYIKDGDMVEQIKQTEDL